MVELKPSEVLAAEMKRVADALFLRTGQTIKVGEVAIKAANERPNVQTEGQGSLQQGDIIIFPATEEKLKSQLFAQTFSAEQKNPTVGVTVLVKRGDKYVAIHLFPSVFTRGIRRVQDAEVVDEEGNLIKPATWQQDMIYPEGAPAKEVRDTPGSIYSSLLPLLGKAIKVERVDVFNDAQVVKPGVVFEAGKRLNDSDYTTGRRRLLAFEYTDIPEEVTAEMGAEAPARKPAGK